MKAVKISDTVLQEQDLPGAKTFFRNFIGQAGVLQDSPQAYLVNIPQRDDYVLPHFHDVDQFQFVVEGSGRCGKQPWSPGAFYYSDAYASYGPIVAGEDGLSFLTLRVASASGQFEMPGSRHLMPGKPGRGATGHLEFHAVPGAGEASEQEVILSRPDGVEVVSQHLGPNASAVGIIPSAGGGAYYVICAGSLIQDGNSLPKTSVMFVGADEEAPLLQAGPDGAVIAILQFSKPNARHGSDPRQLAGRASVRYVVAGETKPT